MIFRVASKSSAGFAPEGNLRVTILNDLPQSSLTSNGNLNISGHVRFLHTTTSPYHTVTRYGACREVGPPSTHKAERSDFVTQKGRHHKSEPAVMVTSEKQHVSVKNM